MKLKTNKGFWSNPITNKNTNTGMSANVLDEIRFPPHTRSEDKGNIAKQYILENFDKDNILLSKCHDRLFVSNCTMCIDNLRRFGYGCISSFRELIEVLLINPDITVTYEYGDWILKNEKYRFGNEYKINY